MSFVRSLSSANRTLLFIGFLFAAIVGMDILSETIATSHAQNSNPLFYDHDIHAMRRGPGGYFAWYKLLIITIVFAGWVGVTDFANREALRLADFMTTKAEVWNPIFVVTFLLGFIAVTSVPWFWAGLPAYVLLCFVPHFFFLAARNQQVDKSMRKAVAASGKVSGPIQILKQEQLDLNPIELVATPQPGQSAAQTLFMGRQTPGFVPLKEMIAQALKNRADIVALSCTREKAVAQMQVDGMWHPMAEFDPAIGHAIASTSQLLAGCNAQLTDRPQDGGFRVAREKSKWAIRFSSQPTRTDFRCVYRFETNNDTVMSLVELGMNEAQATMVRNGIAGDGVYVVASTPGQGVTTLWRACLQATDRWTRDWFSVVPETDTDTIMENVARETFPPGDAKAAIALILRLGLKQAGGYAVPELFDKELANVLLEQSKDEGRKTLTRFSAKSAAEGLLRAYAAAGDRKAMAAALKGVVFQKMVRKLCTHCRETVKVSPEMIQKLGGDPSVQDFVYTTRSIPAERPKEYQPCPVCNDIGFVGRTGIFEIIEVNDSIRKVLLTQPKVENITQIARKTGNVGLMVAGFPLVLDGTTTIEELKRACS